MGEMTGERLLELLQDELGDNLHGLSRYDEEGYNIMYQSEFVDHFFQEYAEKTIDELHKDIRLNTMQTYLDSSSYGATIRCLILVTDVTVAYQLMLNKNEGFFFAVDPNTDIRFPSFIFECIEQLD